MSERLAELRQKVREEYFETGEVSAEAEKDAHDLFALIRDEDLIYAIVKADEWGRSAFDLVLFTEPRIDTRSSLEENVCLMVRKIKTDRGLRYVAEVKGRICIDQDTLVEMGIDLDTKLSDIKRILTYAFGENGYQVGVTRLRGEYDDPGDLKAELVRSYESAESLLAAHGDDVWGLFDVIESHLKV